MTTTDTAASVQSLRDNVERRRVIVCVGSGGVGKTTTSAVIALHGAIMGRKVLALTIDPAKRLANSLGVDALDDEAREIPLSRFEEIGIKPKGQLFAMMLDMKSAFDRLVERYAPDDYTRRQILDNRFYSYFSTSLAGTQEYSAMERLHELYLEGDYDLIVLDTPPTTHALDFLDAPSRLFDALDSSALQWISKPSGVGRWGLNLMSLGTGYVLRVLSKFTGGTFLRELGEFVAHFGTMWEGFKDRAARTKEILSGPDVAFYVVTVPDRLTLEEAMYFFGRLEDEQVSVGGMIVNRVHQAFVPKPVLRADPGEVERRLRSVLDEAAGSDDDLWRQRAKDAQRLDLLRLSERLQTNAGQFHILAYEDEDTIDRLSWRIGRHHPMHMVPFFSTDIYSFKGLERIRRELFELDEREGDAVERTPGRF